MPWLHAYHRQRWDEVLVGDTIPNQKRGLLVGSGRLLRMQARVLLPVSVFLRVRVEFYIRNIIAVHEGGNTLAATY